MSFLVSVPRPPAECLPIIQAKHGFCWTPAAAWEMSMIEICQRCRQKNFDRFVSSILGKNDPRKPKK